MRKHTLLVLDWLLVLAVTNLSLHSMSATQTLAPYLEGSVSPNSLLTSLVLYYFFYITQSRRILFIPVIPVIPVILGNSSIGWDIERYYVETEFVWTEMELKDITHMMNLSLDVFNTRLSETESIGIGVALTLGVLGLSIIESAMNTSDELESRGRANFSMISSILVWFKVDRLLITGLIVGCGGVVTSYLSGLLVSLTSNNYAALTGLVGVGLLMVTISGLIMRKTIKSKINQV